jgi:hypothetical protein
MIKAAKKRGYVTQEQINSVLFLEEVTSEQIEDILAMLNEVGITTVESEETEPEEEAEAREEPEESEGGELVEVQRLPAYDDPHAWQEHGLSSAGWVKGDHVFAWHVMGSFECGV